MMIGNAATVCARSPPASWSRTILWLHCASSPRRAAGIALQHAVDDVVDDRLDAGPLPVLGIDVQPDRDVAAVLRLERGADFVGGGRLGVAEIGRAEQLERAAGERLEQPLRRVELDVGFGVRRARQIGVRVGVAADLVPLGDDPFEQTALGQRILADDEEGRGHALALEDVEDLRRPLRVGPVVEGQRDFVARDSRCAGPDTGSAASRNCASATSPFGAVMTVRCPAVGHRADLEDFALALDIDVGARRDVAMTEAGGSVGCDRPKIDHSPGSSAPSRHNATPPIPARRRNAI